MTRLAPLAGIVLAAAFGVTAVAQSPAAINKTGARNVPSRLRAAELKTLDAVFQGAKPSHTDYIWYPRKVAVIFEFKDVVICGACSAPSNAMLPRGRVIRLSYDRLRHRVIGGYQFCEAKGSSPPRALCLPR